ncbi:hypothetical protein [Algoriphagus confluentis]|uniref:Capsule assembly protein Wzi n=1 Tax=Algoriphagus confluentis TaxID=1697556 RepID=A0ABQ6PQ82_9BACT|nr:hypothetical protein Aconfl_23400 [Algoriphagus confluentis]
MRFPFLLYLFLLIGVDQVWAQEEEKKLELRPDLHFRTFWMSTSYPGLDFKEDYALGMSLNLGGKIKYRENWTFHAGYRMFANVWSSQIWDPDPISSQSNRYETGLFDLLNPKDRFFGRLETLSLEYSQEKFGLKIGRMGINSDWVNAQDGRLAPTAVEGGYAWFQPDKRWKFGIWGVGRMNIRGSKAWLNPGETVGIYPQGRNASGKPADYFQNTTSKTLMILEVDRSLNEGAKVHFSATMAQNLFSTYWLAFDKNRKGDIGSFFYGIQAGFQHGLGKGGNPNSELRYKDPEDLNYSVSGRLGWSSSRWLTHFSLTHVGGKGRWLSPREWGKDAWYTFIPRERNEGFSTVHAWVGYGEYRFQKVPMQIYVHAGIHRLADENDPASNKYNFPSYFQWNLGWNYRTAKVKNLSFHLILMSKQPLRAENLSINQIYNKVELLHINGIINWRWN